MGSNRGQRPVVHVVYSLQLKIQSSRGGYLYCFDMYQKQGRNIIKRIFPNRYKKSAFIAAQQIQFIPDDTMEFTAEIAPPGGPEYVRCYLFDRDIKGDLPAKLREKDLVPLSLQGRKDLDQIMRGIPNINLTQSTLSLSVETE